MDWHSRYLQQAGWTLPLRVYLFERLGLKFARRVLEVGCGTGAVLSTLATPASLYGLDLDPARLVEARTHVPGAYLVCADALALPYPSGGFDMTFCHYLLIWVRDPLQALLEMKRVTRPGGAVLALAEPDHLSRVDRPAGLAALGRWQAEALQAQGADPGLGKRLGALFRQAGMLPVETGTLRDSPALPQESAGSEPLSDPAAWALEWEVLESDLAGRVPPREVRRMKRLDELARLKGERVLYVPTCFAWSIV